ncbi:MULTISPECIES: HlyD family type I secretion periplasmic adaptor subunit [unclassified Oceanobacter]|uniref:HlyD family type I secretion periplasmic adaptor subunit n=1 Tax=unclassified Oceanobacter TaxID=2620260 RepID=UPI002734C800|nr:MULTISPECIES: HlyD family type I secretion periplasmic adaptor subunit [unclassified Oceanobacter]MDP2609221.1 HlyD family type I secretion periplasmic adaptor subunit [Oceanobacter sp. 1_MG-2023]MDP2612487.1 HlyD family type I secretion periplasmic adaptor subunit [Oceanobacter sp. 2_MG-2023]
MTVTTLPYAHTLRAANTETTIPYQSQRYVRAGWLLIIAGVLGFLGWASLTPLDKGVPVNGQLIVEGQRKSLFHPDGGQIERILVRDGDQVHAGQVLIRLNPTRAEAHLREVQIQYDNALALLTRLKAERDGQANIEFPADLMERATDAVHSQQRLFQARQRSLAQALQSYDEIITGMDYQLKGLSDSNSSRRRQRATLDEQLAGMKALEKSGYVSRVRLLEMERLHAETDSKLAENIGQLGQLQQQLQELAIRQSSHQQSFLEQVHEAYAEAELNLLSLAQKLRSAQYSLEQTRVLAPVDGVAMGLSVFTEGGFINPGSHLLDVVPASGTLVVEAQVPVHLIDKVEPGLPVRILFPAANQNRTPDIMGTVATVAADRSEDDQTGLPYYAVLVRIGPDGYQQLEDFTPRPGMSVSLFIRTGERTLMNYLLKPLQDRANSALAEE